MVFEIATTLGTLVGEMVLQIWLARLWGNEMVFSVKDLVGSHDSHGFHFWDHCLVDCPETVVKYRCFMMGGVGVSGGEMEKMPVVE